MPKSSGTLLEKLLYTSLNNENETEEDYLMDKNIQKIIVISLA
jgi:hypothetical protein